MGGVEEGREDCSLALVMRKQVQWLLQWCCVVGDNRFWVIRSCLVLSGVIGFDLDEFDSVHLRFYVFAFALGVVGIWKVDI